MVESAAFRFQLLGLRAVVEHPACGRIELDVSEETAALIRAMDEAGVRRFVEEMERGIWRWVEHDLQHGAASERPNL